MPHPRTSNDFLKCLSASQLVEPVQMDKYAQRLGVLGTPRDLANQMVQDGLLTPFQAQQLLLGRHKNFVVGKYKILEPIGRGGMGTVFLCEHTLMHQRVAMKMLPRQKKEDSALVARFIREAQAVAVLDHPNIIRAHDLDRSSEKFLYFIMDYVEGISLHDLTCKRGRLDPHHAAHYIAQVAEGLHHIHEAGLVHRDIKPANLLLDRTGVIKILDLGLALFQDDDDHITERYNDQTLLGTADYISPEQTVIGGDVDIRSDIYCLGCTFYSLLTGRVPFDDAMLVQKLIGHQTREPRPVREIRHDVPVELLEILKKMMAKRPQERYQTPLELLEDLSPWLELDIPPPAEHELPRLSKAAQGARSSSSTPRGARLSTLSLRLKSKAPPPKRTTPAPIWRTAATLAAIVVLTVVASFSMLK